MWSEKWTILGCGQWEMQRLLFGRVYTLGNLRKNMGAEKWWEERGGQRNLYTVPFNLFLLLHGVIVHFKT